MRLPDFIFVNKYIAAASNLKDKHAWVWPLAQAIDAESPSWESSPFQDKEIERKVVDNRRE